MTYKLEYTLEKARDARQSIKSAVHLMRFASDEAMTPFAENAEIVADHAGKLEYQLSQARQKIKELQARLDDIAAI